MTSDGSQINIDRKNSGDWKNPIGLINGAFMIYLNTKIEENGKMLPVDNLIFRGSSMAERLSVKEDVKGSTPFRGALNFSSRKRF